jgi:hypothetical protein
MRYDLAVQADEAEYECSYKCQKMKNGVYRVSNIEHRQNTTQ